MNTRDTMGHSSLTEKPRCVYCQGEANTRDHAPPRALLQRPFPSTLMTLPACQACNVSFSPDENVVRTLLALISSHPELIAAREPGGSVHRALERDGKLRRTIESSRQPDGNFGLTEEISTCLRRVFTKTVQGLFFGLYGRVVKPEELQLDLIGDRRHITREQFADRYRPSPLEEIGNKPLSAITPSSWHTREPIYIMNLAPLSGKGPPIRRVFRLKRETPIDWVPLQAGIFTYGFVKCDGEDSVCVIELWETLLVAVKAPWPGDRGPVRRGRNNPFSRERRRK